MAFCAKSHLHTCTRMVRPVPWRPKETGVRVSMNLCCPGEVLIIDTLGRERHNLISSNAVAKAVNWNRSAPAGVMTGVKGAVRHLIRQCH